jgi:protein-S-isoprenylcysteine O-methyltransferase Ste14
VYGAVLLAAVTVPKVDARADRAAVDHPAFAIVAARSLSVAETFLSQETPRQGLLAALWRNEALREIAAKLGLAGVCLFLCVGAAVRFALVVEDAPDGIGLLAATRLFAVAGQTIFYLLVLWFTLVRRPVKQRASGWRPRLVAAIGTFAIFGFGILPPAPGLALGWHLAAALLLLGSAALGAIVLTRLGRCFSLMSEARGLVTQGPYRFVRHPLYVVEELAAVAGFIETMSLAAALLLAVQIACQLRRIRNEEEILAASFPEYAGYRATTARLIPGIW